MDIVQEEFSSVESRVERISAGKPNQRAIRRE